MKNIVLWDATPCSVVEIYGYFGESAAFILIPEHGSLEHAQNKYTLINLSALSFSRSTIKVAVLWHQYPCCSVDRYHRFRRNSLPSFGNLEDGSSESVTNDGTKLYDVTFQKTAS